MIRPVQRSIILNRIEMFIQLVERSCVEDVRAGFRAIEDKQTNVIVADLAPNHWTCSNCRHSLSFWNVSGKCQVRTEDSQNRYNVNRHPICSFVTFVTFLSVSPQPLLWTRVSVKNATWSAKS